MESGSEMEFGQEGEGEGEGKGSVPMAEVCTCFSVMHTRSSML